MSRFNPAKNILNMKNKLSDFDEQSQFADEKKNLSNRTKYKYTKKPPKEDLHPAPDTFEKQYSINQ